MVFLTRSNISSSLLGGVTQTLLREFGLPWCYILECTDAAPEEPHPRPTRPDAATWEGRRWPRVRAASGRVLPRGFPDSRRRGSNRAVSAEYRCVSAGKRKSAGKKKKKILNQKYWWIWYAVFTGLTPSSSSFLLLRLLLPFFSQRCRSVLLPIQADI